MRLGGSTVLLPGPRGGIGQAIAKALDERGAKLLISGRRADQLERIAAELGGRPTPLAADLAERSAPGALAEQAGAVDILVANAALPASGPIDDFTPDE